MDQNALGAAIRTFRLRRLQDGTDKPWTLDDLAVEIEDDKAHLSRIERGVTRPTRRTLIRITQALDLSRPEAELLLGLAGFAPLYEPPDDEAAAAAIRYLARARAYMLPFTLYSIDLRIWYCNALWLRLMNLSPQAFRRCLQGRRMAAGSAGCESYARIADRYASGYSEVEVRAVARLRYAVSDGLVPRTAIESLLADAHFAALWLATESGPPIGMSGEQSQTRLLHPRHGFLTFDTWWCPLQIDRRFLTILHLPSDLATREALSAIRREPRPAADTGCARHDLSLHRSAILASLGSQGPAQHA